MSTFEVVRGVEGDCLVLDGTRIAGPKPWGGGRVIKEWHVKETYVDAATVERETCRNVDANADAGGAWHSPRFVCSECEAVYVMSDYAHFCPGCGRRRVP